MYNLLLNLLTQAAVADEILVTPTRALSEADKDYALSFAVPGDWDGVKQLVTIHNFRKREHFPKGFNPGSCDSYVIFDDVFVPWERVFLCGEYKHGGIMALLFALFHRHSYSGCKPAVGDLLLGTCALAADCYDLRRASQAYSSIFCTSKAVIATSLLYIFVPYVLPSRLLLLYFALWAATLLGLWRLLRLLLGGGWSGAHNGRVRRNAGALALSSRGGIGWLLGFLLLAAGGLFDFSGAGLHLGGGGL